MCAPTYCAGTSQASTDVYQQSGSYSQWDPQYDYQAYPGYQPGYDAYTGYGAYQTGYQDPTYTGYQQHQPGYAGYQTEAAHVAHQPQAPHAGQPLPWGHSPQPVQQVKPPWACLETQTKQQVASNFGRELLQPLRDLNTLLYMRLLISWIIE